MEALEQGIPIDKVLIDPNVQIPSLGGLCKKLGIPLQRVPKVKLDYYGQNHQGIAALKSAVSYSSLEDVLPFIYEEGRTPLLMMLDRVTDVGNFGAIARSAEVMGVDALIFPSKETAQLNADAIKRSSGALMRITLCRVPDLIDAATFLQSSGIRLIAADEKGEKPVSEVNLTEPVCFIMGSEGEGIDPKLLRKADQKACIVQVGSMDSLNVSVAAGIMLYETYRQRFDQ